MSTFLSYIDAGLPAFLDAQLMLWIQWFYLAWLLVRKNPLVILLVSLPFHRILKGNSTIVILGSDRDYDRKRDEYMKYMAGKKDLYGLPILRFHEQWAKVEFAKRFYIAHQNALFVYMSLMQDIHGKIVFAIQRKDITTNLVVAKKISYEEGIERIFLRKGHCGKAPAYTVLTNIDSDAATSTALWILLAILPLYLRCLTYLRLSSLVSLVVILLDANMSWLHPIYMDVSSEFIKWVKLNVLRNRSGLYVLLGSFSERWNFRDPNRKMAYYIKPGETILMKDFCRFRSEDDFQFYDPEIVYLQERVGNKYDGCMEIDMARANYVWRQYNNRYLRLKCNINLFVP